MLNEYLPKDICNIITDKLTNNYFQHKIWCNVECKWIYVWTESKKIKNIKCISCNEYTLDLNNSRVISTMKSNGRILKFEDLNIIDNSIVKSNFQILNI